MISTLHPLTFHTILSSKHALTLTVCPPHPSDASSQYDLLTDLLTNSKIRSKYDLLAQVRPAAPLGQRRHNAPHVVAGVIPVHRHPPQLAQAAEGGRAQLVGDPPAGRGAERGTAGGVEQGWGRVAGGWSGARCWWARWAGWGWLAMLNERGTEHGPNAPGIVHLEPGALLHPPPPSPTTAHAEELGRVAWTAAAPLHTQSAPVRPRLLLPQRLQLTQVQSLWGQLLGIAPAPSVQ